MSGSDPMTAASPALSGVVVHWRNESEIDALLDAWPDDPRFELVVVDNSGSLGSLPRGVTVVTPRTNQGFAGGVNRGVQTARGAYVLLLNPDAHPRTGALDRLLEAFARHPDAAGIVPALEEPDGRSQCRWQLRPVPRPWQLVLQTLRLTGVHGPRREPPEGTPVGQPAAAALALRRTAFDAVGGFDEHFFPAWFEDVDFARRLASRGAVLRFAPTARFVHQQGASVPRLGYRRFLWLYYRNLDRYLTLHHGPVWPRLARVSLVLGMAARLAALPLRCPRQAPNRRVAARALVSVALGAVTGFERPHELAALARPAS